MFEKTRFITKKKKAIYTRASRFLWSVRLCRSIKNFFILNYAFRNFPSGTIIKSVIRLYGRNHWSRRATGHRDTSEVGTVRSNSKFAGSNQWPYTVRDDSITIRQRRLPGINPWIKPGSNCRDWASRALSAQLTATARQEHKYPVRKSERS